MVKLYGTLGPACQDTEILRKLFASGMNGVRLNLSHGGLSSSRRWTDNLHRAASAEGLNTELIIDMEGPELRTGTMEKPLPLERGGTVILGTGGIPVPPAILPALDPGQTILLDDGKILLEVKNTDNDGNSAKCRIIRGGLLKQRKSIALEGKTIESPVMTEADLENMALAAESGVTGIMQPFVRSASDLVAIRGVLSSAGLPDARIFAKIENWQGVKMLPELLPEADEIVIARGDLANAVSLPVLPRIQKEIAAVCRNAGKNFMVVTQLLASMEESPVPTRAEVSDIYNAVLDGASSLLVTSETASGGYPVEVMDYLYKTANEAWNHRK